MTDSETWQNCVFYIWMGLMRFSLFQIEEQNPSWQSAPGFVDWQNRQICNAGNLLDWWVCRGCGGCCIPELVVDEDAEVKCGEFQPPVLLEKKTNNINFEILCD